MCAQDHGVNNAEGAVRWPAVTYRMTGRNEDADQMDFMLGMLDTYQGQVQSLLCADEVFCGRAREFFSHSKHSIVIPPCDFDFGLTVALALMFALTLTVGLTLLVGLTQHTVAQKLVRNWRRWQA